MRLWKIHDYNVAFFAKIHLIVFPWPKPVFAAGARYPGVLEWKFKSAGKFSSGEVRSSISQC